VKTGSDRAGVQPTQMCLPVAARPVPIADVVHDLVKRRLGAAIADPAADPVSPDRPPRAEEHGKHARLCRAAAGRRHGSQHQRGGDGVSAKLHPSSRRALNGGVDLDFSGAQRRVYLKPPGGDQHTIERPPTR